MKTINKQALSAMVVLTLLTTSSLWAQPQGENWDAPPMGPPEELQLTDSQEAAMQDLKFKQQAEMIDLKAKLDKQELELRKLQAADEPNEKKIYAQIEKIGATKTTLAKTRAGHRLEARKILTAEQRKIMDKQHRHPRMQGRHDQQDRRIPSSHTVYNSYLTTRARVDV